MMFRIEQPRPAADQLRLSFETNGARGASEKPSPGQIHEVAGLFAGIGGLELGLARAGHRTTLMCENDEAAAAVLRHRFPEVCLHDDIRTLNHVPRSTSLITAGFPCQDLSQAGSTQGIGGARSGLVAEVFRLVKDREIPWLLLENVPFMLQLGRGEAMNFITATLEGLGYKWAYRVVDSRAFGLPQRRRRVYLVASKSGDPRTVLFADETCNEGERMQAAPTAYGFYWTEGLRGLGLAADAVPTLKGGSGLGIPSPPAILLADGRVVTPDLRDAERLQGFRAGWTKPAEKATKKSLRWKLVGNAVSVPAAQWIGRRLVKPGHVHEFDLQPLASNRKWPTAAWNVGDGRTLVHASEWPVNRRRQSLEAFLRHPLTPLSAKATRGFLQRADRAKLRFPPGFLDALRAHLASLTGGSVPVAPVYIDEIDEPAMAESGSESMGSIGR